MTDEQLQEWHTAFLSEAQRENHVNHNLEIVRHHRTEAISRAISERSAIDAAIARHGLWLFNGNGNGDESSSCTVPEEEQPPPMRRPRMEQPQQSQQNNLDAPSGSGSNSDNYGHYVALARIFSDTYTARTDSTPSSNINNNNNANGNANNESNNINDLEDSDINDIAIANTIDTLGLRRT